MLPFSCILAVAIVTLNFNQLLSSDAQQQQLEPFGEFIRAKLPSGRVEVLGRMIGSQDGNATAAGFFGIPYAQPPVGRLRFAAPEAWKPPAAAASAASEAAIGADLASNVDVLEAIEDGRGVEMQQQVVILANASRPACLQQKVLSNSAGSILQSEDCLYLNVLSPVADWDSRSEAVETARAVVAWLHDGFLEAGAISKPERPLGWALVVHEDLVLVEIAYRLGVFGFLKLPGNMGGGNWGLLDQQMALKWISANIRVFGGDPSSVTLAGSGAGAATAGFHLYSPGSVRLFNRVALLGGTPLSPWLLVPDPANAKRITDNFLRRSGCQGQRENGTSDENTLRCLRDADAGNLTSLQPHPRRPLDIAAFPVVVDGSFIAGGIESASTPAQLWPKPALLGATDREGESDLVTRAIGGRNASDITGGAGYQAVLEAAFQFYPAYPRTLGSAGRRLLADSLTAFPSAAAGLGNRRLLSSGLALWQTVCPLNRFVDALLMGGNKTSPAFVYEFVEPDPGRTLDGGASHGQDAAYFLGEPVYDARYTEAQKELSQRMMSALAAFARSNRPSESGWSPATLDNLEFFRYATAPTAVGAKIGGFARQDCRFWDRQLAWVNQLDCEGPTTANPDAAESEFWTRCNQTLNTVSIVTMVVGFTLILLLIISLIAVACSKKQPHRQPNPGRRDRKPAESSAATDDGGDVEMQPSRYSVAPTPLPSGGGRTKFDRSRPQRKARK